MVQMPKTHPLFDEKSELDEFVYRVSHDIGAIALAMVDLPEWIVEDLAEADIVVPEQVENDIQLLVRQSRRLKQMIDDLREYSRVGRMQHASALSPAIVLEDVIALHDAPNVSINWHLPPCQIDMSYDDLLRVFEALISNAIKHNDKDEISVVINGKLSGKHLVVTVHDNGPGINPAHRDVVFDIMRTLKPRDVVDGSGLGLSIARKVFKHYGGKIEVSDQPESGGCTMKASFLLSSAD